MAFEGLAQKPCLGHPDSPEPFLRPPRIDVRWRGRFEQCHPKGAAVDHHVDRMPGSGAQRGCGVWWVGVRHGKPGRHGEGMAVTGR